MRERDWLNEGMFQEKEKEQEKKRKEQESKGTQKRKFSTTTKMTQEKGKKLTQELKEG